MKRSVLLVALLAACESGSDGLPINPGGSGTGGSMSPDAAVEDGDGGTQFTGRVCLVADPRQPATCAASGAGGLTVTLGTSQATTATDGGFVIARPAGTNLTWTVTGFGIEPSALAFDSATATRIPAVTTALYDDMLSSTGFMRVDGNGAIIAQLRRNNAAVVGAIVSVSPVPDSQVFYDGVSVIDWETDATGPLGILWVTSLPPGSASLTVDLGASQPTVAGIPVLADRVTFVLATLP